MGDRLLIALCIIAAVVVVTAIAWALCAHAGHQDDRDGRGD